MIKLLTETIMLSLNRSPSSICDFDCIVDEREYDIDYERENHYNFTHYNDPDFIDRMTNKISSHPRKGNWKVVYELKYKHPVKPKSHNKYKEQTKACLART